MRTQEATSRSKGNPADMSAIDRFIELQGRLLDSYGVEAASRFVDLAVPRLRTHVLEGGRGEPAVLLHGGDGEAVNWAPFLRPLQEAVHFYAVDRPGFGLTEPFDYRAVDLRTHAADFVASLLDALELDSATLIGGSMGGFFALCAALAHPERVRRVVLLGYAAGMTREVGPAMRKICGTPGAAEEFMAGRASMEAQKSQYREMFHTDPAVVSDLYFETRIAGLRLPSEQGTWATLLQRLATAEGLRPELYLGDDLSQLRPSTLVLWGEHDLASGEAVRQVSDRTPHLTFQTMKGLGHFPFLEAPEETAQRVVAFISGRKDELLGKQSSEIE